MEDYWPLIDNWIDNKDGIVLVYSVEIPDSFTEVRNFHTKIINRYNLRDPSKAPIVVLAANKTDLPNRLVSREEG
jgi:GTPase SAR1 family protein